MAEINPNHISDNLRTPTTPPIGDSMDEITLPPDIAHVVAEALGWMWGEGQTSGDEQAEEKLLKYLRTHYPQLCQDWWDGERKG